MYIYIYIYTHIYIYIFIYRERCKVASKVLSRRLGRSTRRLGEVARPGFGTAVNKNYKLYTSRFKAITILVVSKELYYFILAALR